MAELPFQQIVCCIGQPVAGNPIQYMIERGFTGAKLEWRCLTLEISPENLAGTVVGMKAMGFHGGNFSAPHEVAVIEHLDRLSEAAELIGAVNCVRRDGDEFVGENMTGNGFIKSLESITNLDEKKIVVLGAGMTARAIAISLSFQSPAEIIIVNRSADRGQDLVDLLNEQGKVNASFVHWSGDFKVPTETDILVNATSIGQNNMDARIPLDESTLRAELIVAETTYIPDETCFMLQAKKAGCTTVDGLNMFVHRVGLEFQAWTGMDADLNLMREAVEEYLEI